MVIVCGGGCVSVGVGVKGIVYKVRGLFGCLDGLFVMLRRCFFFGWLLFMVVI